MNKKILFLIIILLLFILIGFLLLVFSNERKQAISTNHMQNSGFDSDSANPEFNSSPEFNSFDNHLSPISSYNLPPIEKLKKEEKLALQVNNQTVLVENPYKIAQEIITPQNVLIFSNDTFDILFFDYSGQKSFLLDLHGGTDFATTRTNAENKFLELLKITRDQACLINVSEGISNSLDSNLSGKSLRLSFCSPKK